MMKEVEPEVRKALEYAQTGKDFIMQGGAGSGKTHSMLSFLEELYALRPETSVACVTFTNVAVNEIRGRFPTPALRVSTIHEFLWSLVGRFQKNIRESLATLVNEGVVKSALDLPISSSFWEQPITYKEWLSLEAGEISHDELLKVAKHLFSEHPTLAKILSDQYDVLLIDEYQDTPVDVLSILLEKLPESKERSLRIGFFGDGEQAIHEGEKGQLVVKSSIDSGQLQLITKDQNRRNPSAVLSVINRLRADGLVQVQSTDRNAPNFGQEGTARFVYTDRNELNTDGLRSLGFCQDWRFSSEDTKLLYLGKSMIAREKQFLRLMAIYDKDRAVDYSKRLKEALAKRGISPNDDATLSEVIELHGSFAPPTRGQQEAFDGDPNLLTLAGRFLFADITTTSSSSDRLLGTKKVSELDDRDRGEKRDPLINHLIAIQELRVLFRQGRFSPVMRAVDKTITSIADREQVATDLKALDSMDTSVIGDVIAFAESSGILKRKDAVLRFQAKHPYRYELVSAVPFQEIVNLHEYVEDYSPYSTQHGVKGSEWDNIFVSLDNGGWNNYNFERLLSDPQGNSSVHNRSRMMLYVTCSRAKKNLLVYIHKPAEATLAQAREWFGDTNVNLVG
ncbi:AAA family ATPase [Frigoribacterium sp. CFBP9039]|uniref:UvrD-helicase domain-containing protein n=1 Tax=Frigoribacterium sp. CFBP9029 TaxID=3096541 RepID=UPI002A6B8F31|nr:UvrD-helicase domain-containing protein [Frigoribacterium sp. CFBP9039]MDY0945268.1 AAA family ATPase [Frigoribacterium sp. CFBP9039]